MNTANRLTLFRICLVPVCMVLLYLDFPGSNWAGMCVFIIASLTDLADGHIARTYHQISNFGKFMDPLADKMLVLSAMCWLVDAGRVYGWILAVVLVREFAVSGLRLLAVEQGRVIAAGWSGKVKTTASMIAICFLMVLDWRWLNLLSQATILVTTIYSGAEYLLKNRDVFLEKE
ncbi:MAG: CDP-diacylglycerol--glycerol-3-phosphate 3-phosphatidyltransferase [Oscillospiraceae bacterium]|nr:CDP-diacylglycerol--glycerol-3-phosphate 3-phosphatidyltransferase [Oscillospiraceae bacterium]